MWLPSILIIGILLISGNAVEEGNESDGDSSRKILGSSVVTSVSVVMDTGNGKKTVYTDAIGKPQSKPSNPSELASPIDLLNPDRYEFYTFDDNGDLVKRLMSLDEIKSIIATGDSDAFDLDSFTSQGFLPEKRVSDVVQNVQSVLKEEMEILKDPVTKPIFDTPDVSDSWSMILPAVFGNSGEDIKPEKPIAHITPDTIMLEPNTQVSPTTPAPQKVDIILSSSTTLKNRPQTPSTHRPSSISTASSMHISHPIFYSSQSLLTTPKLSLTTEPSMKVEIFSNSVSTIDPKPTQEPVTAKEKPESKDETAPTRAPTFPVTKPSLIRNFTKPSSLHPTLTTSTITTSSSSSYRPTTIQSVNTTTLKPTTSFKFTSISHKTSLGPSSTTAVPHSSYASTSSQISSSTPMTTLASSTSKIPTKHASVLATIASKLTVKPQLSSTSTVSNFDSTVSSIKSSMSAHLTSALPVMLTKTAGHPNMPELVTEELHASVSTQKPKLSTSSSMDIPSWSPSVEDAELFNIFKETLAKGTTADPKPMTTTSLEDSNTETTIIKETTTSIRNISSDNEYLSTLPTDYSDQKVTTSKNQDPDDPTTKLPSLLHALSDNQKLSASELLDQLLLTTNIYEINTELTYSKINNSENHPVSTDQLTTTTDRDIISYPPTTDITLMQSIEQLLSQAVDDVGTTLNQTVDITKVQQMLQNPLKKNLTDFIVESATLASQITTEQKQTGTTTDFMDATEQNRPDTESTIILVNDNLGSSVEALLSQVYGNTAPMNTMLITEKPNIDTTYRRIDDESKATVPLKATTQKYVINDDMSTEAINDSTVQTITDNSIVEHKEAEQETTTYYYIIKKDANNDSISDMSSSHLINITILGLEDNQNRTKPAKADVSLEQEFNAEELNNISLLSNSTDTFKPSESNIILIQSSTTENGEQMELNNYTTPDGNAPGTTTLLEQSQATEEYSQTFSDLETTTINLILTDVDAMEITTTQSMKKEEITSQIPLERTRSTKKPPKPSIVITINENSTMVTENGKLVANKTTHGSALKKVDNTSAVQPVKFVEKNSSQDQTWTLVSTVAPQHLFNQNSPPPTNAYQENPKDQVHVDLVPKPMQGFGLEESTSNLDTDVYQFAQLCNELAFGFWKTVTTGLSSARSVFVSPFAAISMLAMVFLGAKGATSEEMNEILKLDDMVTFNPHLTFKNVSESITNEPYSGVATTAMIRELFSDRSKGKLLDFYKNRVKAFYDGYVEEVGYREIGDVIRRRSNLLVKKYTNGKYSEFLKDSSITARPPLSGVSINIFETDCSHTSNEGRDGEIHFVVLPSIRQRRLVPIPAVVYRSDFLAGYEPSLDATAVSLGTKEQIVSTILVIPGQQGIAALGDGLAKLEKRLVESSFKKGAWSRLLRSLIPRPGLEVQIPRFSHRSIINATNTLQKMGLHELFNPDSADLRGLNGVANELHLSDVLQINSFATCGEKRVDESHHSEVYPATTLRARAARYLRNIPLSELDAEPRDYQRAFHDPLHDPSLLELPLSLRPRQARIPEIPRLRFDRPFLYFIRHNPTGLILHMGRFNPRLLP